MKTSKLQIGAAPWSPWVVHDIGNASSIRGVAIEVYEAMRRKGLFNYHLQRDAAYGGSLVKNKWTGLIGAMLRNETDIGGPLFVYEDRAKAVQYAAPLGFGKLAILSGLVPANKNPYLIFGIFSIEVWLIILASIIFAAGAACMIYSILPSEYSKKKLEAFLRFLWMFESSLLGKEFGANSRLFLRHIWSSPSFKLLEGIWILSCLVLTYTYQGTIISTYAADKLKPKYETLEDLIADPRVIIGTFEKSYPLLCMSKLANTDLDDIWIRIQKNLVKPVTEGVPTWLDPIEEGKAAYVYDFVYAKYILGERFKKTGKCGIRVTPIEVCASSIAIVMRKDLSPRLLEKMNDGILRFNEGALTMRHLSQTVLFYDICTHSSSSPTQPLHMSDLTGAFTVLGAGLISSLLYFALEIFTGRKKKKHVIA